MPDRHTVFKCMLAVAPASTASGRPIPPTRPLLYAACVSGGWRIEAGYMRRRAFIAGVGGAAVWPSAALAQQVERVRRVGALMTWLESDPEAKARAGAFQDGLRALGWDQGRNLRIEYRWGGVTPDIINTQTPELIELAPDVIVTSNTIAAQILRRSPRSIPSVFVGIADPVGSGVVVNLARPGGNVTGLTAYEPTITGKWLTLLKEIAPNIQRVALIFHPRTPFAPNFLRSLEADAPSFGVKTVAIAVRDAPEIEHGIGDLAREPGGGLLMVPETTATLHRDLIIALAARHRIPAIYPYSYHATQGGLASYGIDVKDQWRRAASYVDRLLKGEQPANLPVQAPNKFELFINLKTAKALGLKFPQSMVVAADEVLE